MPRALKNLDITLGLAVIPVQLFTATSSQGVAFPLLHARRGSRIQMRLECPIHGIVPREETVRGYDIAKDEYVRFEPEELKALEQASSSALVIDSFVPEGAIDPVYFEDTYYLGAGKNSERGYRVLVQALEQTKRVAVSRAVTAEWERDYVDVQFRVADRLFIGEIKVTGWLRLEEAFRAALGQLLEYGHLRFDHCPGLVMFLDQPLDVRRVRLASDLGVAIVSEVDGTYRANPQAVPELQALLGANG